MGERTAGLNADEDKRSKAMITITLTQNKYLLRLEEKGSMTTRDLMLDGMVTIDSAGKIIKKLKEAGLIESTRVYGGRGNILIHRLKKPYSELDIQVSTRHPGVPIQEEEIYYAAILRNGLMVGQRLSTQYHKVFPDRAEHGISNIVEKARHRGLCR